MLTIVVKVITNKITRWWKFKKHNPMLLYSIFKYFKDTNREIEQISTLYTGGLV